MKNRLKTKLEMAEIFQKGEQNFQYVGNALQSITCNFGASQSSLKHSIGGVVGVLIAACGRAFNSQFHEQIKNYKICSPTLATV